MKTKNNFRMSSENVRIFEYTAAADPSTFMTPIPFAVFPSKLHEVEPTSKIIPLSLQHALKTPYDLTGPNLLASFIRILPNESITSLANCTSNAFYVIRGSGKSIVAGTNEEICWSEKDLFTVPMNVSVTHFANTDTAIYWINDSPLLNYLGVVPEKAQFQSTLYTHERLKEEILKVNAEKGAENRNRMGILLGNANQSETKTLTHTLWALWNALPKRLSPSTPFVQPPHRHNSIAIDLCVSAGPNTYTMMAKHVDEHGNLIDPVRADWIPGSVFITPPGLWHSHHNESDEDAIVLPMQDAGLYTYQRTLDIRFASRH
jgi:gentisate 1,2-dioxygenase